MAKFCPECAHPIIDGNSQFCPKCGARLPITSPEVQPPSAQQPVVQQPTHPSYYTPVSASPSSVQTPAPQQGPTTEGAKKPRSTVEWIAICCGGVILLVVVAAFISGMASNVSSGSSSSDNIISQDLSSITLTINDFPTGWQKSGSPNITAVSATSNFVKVEKATLSADVVYLYIKKYPDIAQAKAEYQSKKAKITDWKVESVNLGNEGFGYVTGDSSYVIFRRGNIIVHTQYGVGGFGGSLFPLSISDAKNYAEIVANRIK